MYIRASNRHVAMADWHDKWQWHDKSCISWRRTLVKATATKYPVNAWLGNSNDQSIIRKGKERKFACIRLHLKSIFRGNLQKKYEHDYSPLFPNIIFQFHAVIWSRKQSNNTYSGCTFLMLYTSDCIYRLRCPHLHYIFNFTNKEQMSLKIICRVIND